LKRIRHFKGYNKGVSNTYRLIAHSTSKKKLEQLGDRQCSYRIITHVNNHYLYVYK